MRLTFKTEEPKGKYRAFHDTIHYIKIDGVEVGTIGHNEPHKIRLKAVKDDAAQGNPNCSWKWVVLKKDFTTLQEAKDFLKINFEKILKKVTIAV